MVKKCRKNVMDKLFFELPTNTISQDYCDIRASY